MSQLVIEPHYLGSLEYYALLLQYEEVCFEIHDSFQKQTNRNRAYFLAANKVQPLIIPVKYASGSPTKEVVIDYSQRWLKDHWGAFYSAYGKAPFFEYFQDDFKAIWDSKISGLVELNISFVRLVFKILQKDIGVSYTKGYEENYENDFRDVISPKKPFSDRKIYQAHSYPQLFGDTFVPNLSIIDLIMNEGPNAAGVLINSFRGTK